ncbi:MAG TPA: hypothetical protein VLK33_00860 [Terriglobales bacterium]|nr:hypothetical protein [Terriglobales bacterium]
MSPVERRKLGLVRYWQGQKLRSSDFNDIHSIEAQRRWWHNRALHNAYGIHEGFLATADAGATAIRVQAGLAYDDSGRELILESDQVVPVPNISTDGNIVLFVGYREKIAQPRPQNLARAGCSNSTPQFVEFVWRKKDSCQSADGVPLAEVKFLKGKRAPVTITLPSTRPLARPLLATGSTVAGNTAWELWTAGWAPTQRYRYQSYGVQTTIDTSAAGFTDEPCYFAWLEGPAWSPQTRQIVPAIFPSIAEQSLNSFVFRLGLPPDNTGVVFALAWGTQTQRIGPEEFALFAARQKLYVTWVGCQKNVSAPFLALLLRIPLFSVEISQFENVLLKLNKL